jgi:hypothetical protein
MNGFHENSVLIPPPIVQSLFKLFLRRDITLQIGLFSAVAIATQLGYG